MKPNNVDRDDRGASLSSARAPLEPTIRLPPRRRLWRLRRVRPTNGMGRPRAQSRPQIRASSASNISLRTSPLRLGAEASRRPPINSAGNPSVIDGQGTADGIRRALQQAIALQPNGIVLASVDAQSNVGLMKEANAAGIKIVGIHSVANPGPAPEVGLFTNVTCEPKKQGALGASMAIADAKGAAQLVAVTDTQYAIARAKADAAQATIKACPTCKMLAYVSTPVGSANQNMPGYFTSWIQKYPDPFYVYTVTDAGFFDPGRAGVAHRRRSAERADRLDRLRRQPRRLPAHPHGNL